MSGQSNCENCINYVYDEYYDWYVCDMDLDEDETVKFVQNNFSDCPYFRFNDEYKTVRKQI